MNTVSASPVEGLSAPLGARSMPHPSLHGLMALSFVGVYASADSERWRLLHITWATPCWADGVSFGLFLMGPKPSRWQAWHCAGRLPSSLSQPCFRGLGVSRLWWRRSNCCCCWPCWWRTVRWCH